MRLEVRQQPQFGRREGRPFGSSAPHFRGQESLDIVAATDDDSANRADASSTLPVSRCASALKYNAVSRHGLHGGSWASAKVTLAIICSGPAAHITARNMARAESNDVPSTGAGSNEAASRTAIHRCASAICPVNAAAQPASTASGGYFSIAGSPSAESHRCTVDMWPAL